MSSNLQSYVLLYGAMKLLEQAVNARTAQVWLTIETDDGEISEVKVLVKERRALETLAFYQMHQELHPDAPFIVSIQGRLRRLARGPVLEATSITFQVAEDVTRRGGRLAHQLIARYTRTYGQRPWLETKS